MNRFIVSKGKPPSRGEMNKFKLHEWGKRNLIHHLKKSVRSNGYIHQVVQTIAL